MKGTTVHKISSGAAALAMLVACGQDQATATVADSAVAAAPRSGIIIEHMDKSIRPGDDFFSYVNGAWVEDTEIPKDRASYSVFAVLHEESQENVKAIIEESVTGNFAKGSDEQKVGDLYQSYMDMETRNAKGTEPLQPEVDRINALADYDELAVYFAAAIKRGLDAPFGITQFPDLKNPKFYAYYAFQSGLGLPDREYYFNEDDKSVEIRGKYVEHIEKMFELAALPDGAMAAQAIMALESRLAESNMKKEDTRDWAANYDKVAIGDLGELMPKFNWDGYIAEAGVADVDGLVIIMTEYMRDLDEIIEDYHDRLRDPRSG